MAEGKPWGRGAEWRARFRRWRREHPIAPEGQRLLVAWGVMTACAAAGYVLGYREGRRRG